MNKIKVVTHNGRFHADDVCAVAVLSLVYSGNIEVARTRDVEVMEHADIVLDVGGKNDGEKYFDHHQQGGAGARANTVPYASFGLIWKKFGSKLTSSQAVSEKFDHAFVQPVDAMDNGVVFIESKLANLVPFGFNSVVYSFNPTWKEDDSLRDTRFLEAVEIFKKIIERVLTFLGDEEEAKALILKNYEQAEDKRIVVLDSNYPFHEVLGSLPEPVYAVHQSPQHESWHIGGVWDRGSVFAIRKPFPESWAGKTDAELEKITGVKGAIFCHTKRFLTTAKTKEAALALAKLSLEA